MMLGTHYLRYDAERDQLSTSFGIDDHELAADIPAHNKAAQIAVEADPENMAHLPRPGKAAGCQKELGALDPDLKAAIEQSITKGLQVKRMTPGAQRLKNVLETHPSATDPSASKAETPSLQTKLDACQLLNAAYERTIAVLANEVVTLQIVQTVGCVESCTIRANALVMECQA